MNGFLLVMLEKNLVKCFLVFWSFFVIFGIRLYFRRLYLLGVGRLCRGNNFFENFCGYEVSEGFCLWWSFRACVCALLETGEVVGDGG